jgi:hypothetical protein
MSSQLRVFISSTSEDLQEYRAVARLVVLDMGWTPVMMEHFNASPEPVLKTCTDRLASCDLMVLLVAFRRGTVPAQEQGGNGKDSYTAHELKFAGDNDIPVLAFLANETWPGNLWEEDPDARQWVKSFRESIGRPAVKFSHEEPTGREPERLQTFRTKLRAALVSHREHGLEKSAPKPPVAVDYTDIAVNNLLQGNCLPFLGSGIFDTGPLSALMLSTALLKEQAAHEPSCLATAAEYFERLCQDRTQLLSELTRILQEQSSSIAPPLVHDLLATARLRPPALVVSTTVDLTFERCLEAAGARFTIVTHILRSVDGVHDGKILVLRSWKADPVQICLSDQLELGDEDFVIYKPLGSPLLHSHVDPDLEIDTVVITESDHMMFLGRLQHEHTRVPSAFHRAFQRRPLLFIGYPLDEWQYRLVAQVFDAVGTNQHQRKPPRVAVREPSLQMEELSWRRLGVDLIREDPNDFARRTMPRLEAARRMANVA